MTENNKRNLKKLGECASFHFCCAALLLTLNIGGVTVRLRHAGGEGGGPPFGTTGKETLPKLAEKQPLVSGEGLR